jgi:hypothetical protein
MKNLFDIREEEKNRILNLHESATKRQYITEAFENFPCVAKHPNAKSITLNDGSMAYDINGVTYYGNGRKSSANGNVSFTCNDAEFKTQSNTQTPAKANNGVELQKLLNSKFQAGLKEDGKVGPLTIAAALKALGGGESTGTQTPATGTQTPATGTQTPATGTQTPATTGTPSFQVSDGNF